MDTMSIKDEDNYLTIVDDCSYNNTNGNNGGTQSPVSSRRNLSPPNESERGGRDRGDRERDRERDRDRDRGRDRSRSRSYDNRRRSGGGGGSYRSRSPRSRRDYSRDRNDSRRSDSHKTRSSFDLKYRWEKTVYVSNIPYDLRWTDLKDLFRNKVGDVVYCEVFEKDGRSMGVATLEFRTVSDAERAIEVMHQYELGGRRISVRMDNEGYKTKQAKEMSDLPQSSSSKHSSSRHHDDTSSSHTNSSNNTSLGLQSLGANTNPLLSLLCSNPLLAGSLGANNLLSSTGSSSLTNQNVLLNQIAAQLKVEGPVTNRIFIASLDYKVDENKLKEVYSLAGTVQSVSLFRDRDGRSRGMAVVEYENPFEALNAVSMFNHQQLLDRQMTVRFDTKPPEENSKSTQSSSQAKLPSGLKSIGTGLNLNSLLTTNVPAVNQLSLGALTSLAGIQNQTTTTTPDFAALASNFGLTLNGTGILGNIPPSSSSTFNGNQNGSSQLSTNGNSTHRSSSSASNHISKIFVKNIPFSWDERKLKEKFRQAGLIENVDIKMKDGKSRGFGLIRYATPEQANKAVELFNGSRFEGRTLEVKLDQLA